MNTAITSPKFITSKYEVATGTRLHDLLVSVGYEPTNVFPGVSEFAITKVDFIAALSLLAKQ